MSSGLSGAVLCCHHVKKLRKLVANGYVYNKVKFKK